MSGFGSSLQLQNMANKVRSSLNAPAKETFTDDSGNTQERRLLATTDADSDTTDDSESNSITKFAKALGKLDRSILLMIITLVIKLCDRIDVDVSNLFLTTFFLFWILLIALQVLGLLAYGLRICLAGSFCCRDMRFGPVERKEHSW
jgi:hypothetical protein